MEMVSDFLLVKFLEVSRKKPRYFLNSEHHRLKLRCLQPLLFLSELSKIFEVLLKELLEQNNQQSVTHLLEVLLASICSEKFELLEKLLDELNLTRNHKPQAVQSLISIIFLAYRKNREILKGKLPLIINKIFIHTMGQNFATRLHAQFVIQKLMSHVEESSNLNCLKIWISEVLDHENSKKTFDLTKNLMFGFELEELFSFDAFYCHIPRITNMSADEFCDRKNSGEYLKGNHSIPRISENGTAKFLNFKKNPGKNIVSNEFEVHPCSCKSNDGNFQQKYQISFKQLLPDENSFLEFPAILESASEPQNRELIVVASLVSRPPNLGGLARTGEVFGIKELVIDSISHVKNFEFQALR